MLARAERLHREFFRPGVAPGVPTAQPTWEPPVDVVETDDKVLVLVALPGVAADEADAAIDGADLVVGGTRILPAALRHATIHRLELPQGRFRRRVPLPPGRYRDVRRSVVDGCLVITLQKA